MSSTESTKKTGTAARWPAPFDKRFCPVSSYFLANIGRLKLKPQEALLIIQILDHKWGERLPHPSIQRLANKMGLSERTVRTHLSNLNRRGLVVRKRRTGLNASGRVGIQTNQYDFEGLYREMEKLRRKSGG